MTKSVAFIVAPYGFGPLSKSLAVSSYLPRHIARSFIGFGASLDAAKRTGEFTESLELDFASPPSIVHSHLSGFDCLLFINTTRFISATSALSSPIMLLETLAWLRQSQPDYSHLLTKYFAQRFLDRGFADALEEMDKFLPVGAIIPRLSIRDLPEVELSPEEKLPILHCGGLFSTEMIDGADYAYVLQALNFAKSLKRRIRIILPEHLHAALKHEFTDLIELVECSPLTVCKHLARSSFALSTTGIEFTYECMNLGIPVSFLPPFNASQIHQLSEHQRICPESILFETRGKVQSEAFELLHTSTAAMQREGIAGLWTTQFGELQMALCDVNGCFFEGVLRRISEAQSLLSRRMRFDGAKIVSDDIIKALGVGVVHD